MRQFLPAILGLALLWPLAALPVEAWAQQDPTERAKVAETRASAEDDRATFTLQYENDLLAGTDQQYTNGFRAAYLSSTGGAPEWLRSVRPWLTPLLDAEGAMRVGFAFGQNLYTPNDTDRRTLDRRDRPYAAWTYATISLVTDTGSRLDTVALDIGVVGPAALGEQVQNNVHRLMGVDKSNGWDNQIDNEPGVNLIWQRKWRIAPRPLFDDFGFDVTPMVGASLGNVFTHASAGAAFRFGQDLKADYGPPRIRPSVAGSDFYRTNSGWGWYLFAGFEGRAVARDITLDGNSFRDSHSVDKEILVGDAQFGFAILYEAVRLAFTYDMRTKEFDGQRENVRFGAISLSTRF